MKKKVENAFEEIIDNSGKREKEDIWHCSMTIYLFFLGQSFSQGGESVGEAARQTRGEKNILLHD